MESINSSSNPPTRCINGLTKTQLKELCKGIVQHMIDYDFLIQGQITLNNENCKEIVLLCERRLELLNTYKNYINVLSTLSAYCKRKIPSGKMVSERDPHE